MVLPFERMINKKAVYSLTELHVIKSLLDRYLRICAEHLSKDGDYFYWKTWVSQAQQVQKELNWVQAYLEEYE